MKRKELLALIGGVCLILVLAALPFMAACAPEEEATPEERILIGSGGEGSTTYVMAGAIMRIINEYVPGLRATAEATGGWAENAKLVGRGEQTCGFVGLDFAYAAIHGTDPYTEKYDLAIIYWDAGPQVYWFTLDPKIKSIEDFRGKSIATGEVGSGTANMTRGILLDLGLTEADYKAVWLGEIDANEALIDGTVDVVGTIMGAGQASGESICATEDVFFIGYAPGEIDKILANHPTWLREVVAAGTFTDLHEDYETISMGSLFCGYGKVDEELIYKITKAIWEHIDVMRAAHEHCKLLDINYQARDGFKDLPMHPGAVRYYKEVGVIK